MVAAVRFEQGLGSGPQFLESGLERAAPGFAGSADSANDSPLFQARITISPKLEIGTRTRSQDEDESQDDSLPEERHVCLIGHGLGEHGLAAAGGPEQDSAWTS